MAFLPFEMDGVMPLFDMPSPSLGAFVLPRLRNPHSLTTPGSSDSNNSDSDSDLLVCRRRPRPASPSPPRPCDPAVLDKTARAFAEDIARARAALKDTTLDDVLQQTCNAALDQKQPTTTSAEERDSEKSSGICSLKRRLEDKDDAVRVPMKRMRCVDGRALSEAETAVLAREGLTGVWAARFHAVFRALTALQARGSDPCTALETLGRCARSLTQTTTSGPSTPPSPQHDPPRRYRALRQPRRKAPRTDAL